MKKLVLSLMLISLFLMGEVIYAEKSIVFFLKNGEEIRFNTSEIELIRFFPDYLQVQNSDNYKGIFYSQLHKIGLAEKTSVSPTQETISNIFCYPTQTTGLIYIPSYKTGEKVSIIDNNGRFMYEVTSGVIDISHLQKGLYFITMNGNINKVIKL